MQFLTFVVQTSIQLYIIILLLRTWMQWVKTDFYNPFSQFILRITQPTVRLFSRFIPSIGIIDTISLLVAYALTVVNILFAIWITNTLSLISITLIPISFIQLLTYAGKLVFWLILIRSIFSLINHGRHPIDYMLIQLTERLISPIRRIVPSIDGIDFSPMIIMLMLIALNYLRLDILSFIDATITRILFQSGI